MDNHQKQPLPNATTVLVLGICSIVIPFGGLILGIIGITLSAKGRKMNSENPGLYEGYGLLNAGWIMSIIGTVFGGITALYFLSCFTLIYTLLSPFSW